MDDILQHLDHNMTQEDQQKINAIPVDPTGFNPGDEEFIKGVMQMVFSGQIDTMIPSSLLNQSAYNQAEEMIQGKADMAAVNLCSKLRNLEKLMELSGGDKLHIEPTYQVQTLVADIRYRKEQFENQYGNLFLI